MNKDAQLEILKSLIPESRALEFIIKMVDAIPSIVAILNEDRRLIYSNRKMAEALSIDNIEEAFMLRPGELFECVNAHTTPGGCGTSETCEFCGAMQAMKSSRLEEKTITNKFRLLGSSNGETKVYNFNFTSTAFTTFGKSFYLISLEDISSEIRKAELEQIFFHDVMNAVGSLFGVIELLKEKGNTEQIYIDILEGSYNALFDLISEQKQYAQAETGALSLKNQTLHTMDLLIETTLPFMESRNYKSRIQIDESSVGVSFTSDSALLTRVLTNMIKNAMEASKKDDIVTIGADTRDDKIRFWVHNPVDIPRDAQLQIFERSFSTKGKGRGLGTFSMKLLGENYLGGKVSFTSNEEEGTTFSIELPVNAAEK
jgi:K+-sensing histidine kinase KdpD